MYLCISVFILSPLCLSLWFVTCLRDVMFTGGLWKMKSQFSLDLLLLKTYLALRRVS